MGYVILLFFFLVRAGATGIRAKEGTMINKSLLTLGTVISKLSEGTKMSGVLLHNPGVITNTDGYSLTLGHWSAKTGMHARRSLFVSQM